MEQEKNNQGVIVLLVIIIVILLTLVVLLATGTISFKSETSSNNQTADNNQIFDNNNEVEETTLSEEESLPEWAEYLLSQNISSITVAKFPKDGFDPEEGCPEPQEITKEQLRKVLSEVTKAKLTKYEDIGGFGGACLTNIKVKYNNTKEFELFLYKYIDVSNTDSEIIRLLEKENYTNVESRTNPPVPENPQSMFEYDWDDSYLDTLLG